ncbi:hypothetical protein ASE75_09255 [Sphingomonas sp. Leaf17]|uniref:sulfotransferase family protein n=1 Tax=Sphingomonas sp. Leaf17 TaxID=1735683 RepID=UPI000701850A|nr:sulfotransferase family protein [Sphingomonas sp. Leaf17]KQM64181.1 hypothetical protein ASE75_09255 [Sphingomonas sp. Leaf17]
MFGGLFFYHNGEIVDPAVQTETPPPRHMLVTGVGRGGTTAAACMIEALGFKAEGANLYRESKHLFEYIRDGNGAAAAEHLKSWSTSEDRMFWKDPKIWVPTFDPFLSMIPDDIGVLVIVRDPLNIAARNAALRSADILAETLAAAKSTVKLVSRMPVLTKRSAIVMSYEKLMLNTAEVVNEIARYLGITSEEAIAKAITMIEPTPSFYQGQFDSHISRKTETPATSTTPPPAPSPPPSPAPPEASADDAKADPAPPVADDAATVAEVPVKPASSAPKPPAPSARHGGGKRARRRRK